MAYCKNNNRKTFIYMMRNARNGFVKIGISDKPEYREKTLQSEEPEVELIWSFWTFAAYEQNAHEMFPEKRIRGEWFSLSPKEIATIKSAFESDLNIEKFRCLMAAYGYPLKAMREALR